MQLIERVFHFRAAQVASGLVRHHRGSVEMAQPFPQYYVAPSLPNSVLKAEPISFWSHLHRVGQGNGDGQWQPLGHSHHEHGDPNDEELDKVLDVDGGALG